MFVAVPGKSLHMVCLTALQWHADIEANKCPGFVYYASMGSGDPYHLSLNSYTTFLDDCGIPDNDSASIKRSDCDTIFIVCNFQPDKKSAEALVNDEHAMMRYEFLECIVRLGECLFAARLDDVCSPSVTVHQIHIYG
jgi:hypothetical protein